LAFLGLLVWGASRFQAGEVLDGIDPNEIWFVDGDTFTIDKARYRIRNLDAPELPPRAGCQLETERGYEARREAKRLIQLAGRAEVRLSGAEDDFGRPLVTLTLDGQDFAELMIAEGLAAPFTNPPRDWCAD
jgi:endonuclease YncB( thermonuclease family)